MVAVRTAIISDQLSMDFEEDFSSLAAYIEERFAQISLIDEYVHIRERVKYFHFKDYRKTGSGFLHAIFGEGDVGYKNFYRCMRTLSFESLLVLSIIR